MEFALVLPIILILLIAVWVIRGGKKWDNDKRVVLYNSLMSKGCHKCHGELELGEMYLGSNYLNAECKSCGASYDPHPELQMAWENDDE